MDNDRVHEMKKVIETPGGHLPDEILAALIQWVDDQNERAYVRGMSMARSLLRLQLGLGTPEDNKC